MILFLGEQVNNEKFKTISINEYLMQLKILSEVSLKRRNYKNTYSLKVIDIVQLFIDEFIKNITVNNCLKKSIFNVMSSFDNEYIHMKTNIHPIKIWFIILKIIFYPIDISITIQPNYLDLDIVDIEKNLHNLNISKTKYLFFIKNMLDYLPLY